MQKYRSEIDAIKAGIKKLHSKKERNLVKFDECPYTDVSRMKSWYCDTYYGQEYKIFAANNLDKLKRCSCSYRSCYFLDCVGQCGCLLCMKKSNNIVDILKRLKEELEEEKKEISCPDNIQGCEVFHYNEDISLTRINEIIDKYINENS